MNTNHSMPKKLKTKWLNALRSGKYEQTIDGNLYDSNNNSYCCLGVLEKIADNTVERRGLPSMEWLKNHAVCFIADDGGELTDDPVLILNKGKNVTTLSELNDGGRSFKQIANLIEKHIKGV